MATAIVGVAFLVSVQMKLVKNPVVPPTDSSLVSYLDFRGDYEMSCPGAARFERNGDDVTCYDRDDSFLASVLVRATSASMKSEWLDIFRRDMDSVPDDRLAEVLFAGEPAYRVADEPTFGSDHEIVMFLLTHNGRGYVINFDAHRVKEPVFSRHFRFQGAPSLSAE